MIFGEQENDNTKRKEVNTLLLNKSSKPSSK
jgi:hypothetical protein